MEKEKNEKNVVVTGLSLIEKTEPYKLKEEMDKFLAQQLQEIRKELQERKLRKIGKIKKLNKYPASRYTEEDQAKKKDMRAKRQEETADRIRARNMDNEPGNSERVTRKKIKKKTISKLGTWNIRRSTWERN
ncbi:hypothetical protein QE152_g11046 [Popillia japonica]|uniref:Uncharacterized protein n=1 Tax=Popillia japonica TaxID=7064 RepID=A0AAW1LT23_POPJA